jgi:hypothetical protein
MYEDRLTASGRRGLARFLLVVGSILFAISVTLGIATQFVAANLMIPAYAIFGAALAIIHVPMLTFPDDSGKFYIVYTNLLNSLGAASLFLGLSTWVFLLPGLVMAFLAYFVLRVPYARGTEFLWGSALVMIGAAFVLSGNLYAGSAIQAAGLLLSGLTIGVGFSDYNTDRVFDRATFRVVSVVAWVLSLGILYWVLIPGNYYIGFSWLVEGVLLGYSVSRLYGGFWPVWMPAQAGISESLDLGAV